MSGVAAAAMLTGNRATAGASFGPAGTASDGVFDICASLVEYPDDECIVAQAQADGPLEPTGPGEASDFPLPFPLDCPNPDPAAPQPYPPTVLEFSLACISIEPLPLPSATFDVGSVARPADAARRAMADDEKMVLGGGTFNLAGLTRNGYTKAYVLLSASTDVLELNGVVIAKIKAEIVGGETTRTIRFTSFTRGKFKDPVTGKEIEGFRAEAPIGALRPTIGTDVTGEFRGVAGAVLLKGELEDRPITWKKALTFNLPVTR